MNHNQNIIFSESDCPQTEVFYNYLEGKLSQEQTRDFEMHLASCEMCSDLLEGIELAGDRKKTDAIISKLKTQILEKTQTKKPRILRMDGRMRNLAAAVILVLIVVFVILNNNLKNDEESFVAAKAETKERVILAQEMLPENEASEEEKSDDAMKSVSENDERTVIAQEVNSQGSSGEVINRKTSGEIDQIEIAEDNSDQISVKEFDAQNQDKDGSFEVSFSSDESVLTGTDKKSAEKSAKIDSKTRSGEDVTLAGVNLEERDRDDGFRMGLFSREKRKGSTENSPTYKSNRELSGSALFKNKEDVVLEEKVTVNDVEEQNNELVENDKTPKTTTTNTSTIADCIGSGEEQKALELFDQNKHEEAIIEFETILKEKPSNNTSLYYSSLSLLAIGETEKAEQNLNKILSDTTNSYYQQAKWQLANLYLKKGEKEKARLLLQEIINNKEMFKTKALELLETL